jgi:C1A family cysteine protease
MSKLRVYLSPGQLASRCKRVKIPSPPVQRIPPVSYSLVEYMPSFLPYDQGQIGSCTANAFCGAYSLLAFENATVDKNWQPSRLWCYYNERRIEDPNAPPLSLGDTGADVSDLESFAISNGICSESLWPYDPSLLDQNSTADMIADAALHKISSSYALTIDNNLITSIENVIAAGSPVLIAINVYDSFEADSTTESGIIPIPDTSSEQLLGGHEVLIISYDNNAQMFGVLNSWGSEWPTTQYQAPGVCQIPFAYIMDPNLTMQLTVICL